MTAQKQGCLICLLLPLLRSHLWWEELSMRLSHWRRRGTKRNWGCTVSKDEEGLFRCLLFFLVLPKKNAAGAWGVQGCPMVSGTILTEDSLGPVGCQVEPPWKGFAPVYPTGAWSDWAMGSVKTGSLPRTHFVSFNCWVVVQFPAEETGGAACHRGHVYRAENHRCLCV